jgi:hypothetical protein
MIGLFAQLNDVVSLPDFESNKNKRVMQCTPRFRIEALSRIEDNSSLIERKMQRKTTVEDPSDKRYD